MIPKPVAGEKSKPQVRVDTCIESTIGHIESAMGYIESTIGQLQTDNTPQPLQPGGRGKRQKIIRGRVLVACDGVEQPTTNVRVELYTVSPLKAVASALPKEVLDHCRTLLLEKSQPIDLYPSANHVADGPVISFADILKLRETPGYELLAAAAKSQSDASFTQLLCNNPAILQPLLCYYHPGIFSAACTDHTTTDAAGFFNFAVVESGNAEEQPGYRFIVRRSISRNLFFTLYNPMPAAWHTHWNLSDDKTVTLRTRHPLALRERP